MLRKFIFILLSFNFLNAADVPLLNGQQEEGKINNEIQEKSIKVVFNLYANVKYANCIAFVCLCCNSIEPQRIKQTIDVNFPKIVKASELRKKLYDILEKQTLYDSYFGKNVYIYVGKKRLNDCPPNEDIDLTDISYIVISQ